MNLNDVCGSSILRHVTRFDTKCITDRDDSYVDSTHFVI
jgi:hypothetical protein